MHKFRWTWLSNVSASDTALCIANTGNRNRSLSYWAKLLVNSQLEVRTVTILVTTLKELSSGCIGYFDYLASILRATNFVDDNFTSSDTYLLAEAGYRSFHVALGQYSVTILLYRTKQVLLEQYIRFFFFSFSLSDSVIRFTISRK